jgi:Flp pilus assembly protein TadG
MKIPTFPRQPGRRRSRGQSLVEFSLVIIPFTFLIMGIFDLGRGIYQMNGTAQAAREIARVASVHSGCPQGSTATCDIGASTEISNVVATQQRLLPGMAINTSTDIMCVTINDVTKSPDVSCLWGTDYVRVRVTSSFTPITPLLSMFGSHTFESYSRVRYYP